ncbi:MAG TPA: SDR family NAD(P)-dependent oxidoreductase [Methylomirabilota bacterium]|jgi:NAD(P)-dependent dehydrogenase (short-subunit alcohol dehydrogenase family)|nr:SDR family NAD(P)-dependent oxidoreductase [Methylomirabilota bacterium]
MGVLDGKVAIVTGAGRLRGIGRAAAVALAQLGADVVVTGTGRDPAKYPPDEKAVGWRDIESTAQQVREVGRRCLPVVADVVQRADVARTVEATLKEFGRIDFLINNSAFARGPDRVPLVELSEELWRKVLEIKLTGSFFMSKAVIPTMIKQGQGGAIINISSIAGKRGMQNAVAYCTSNFGIQGFTQALAMEVAPHNIRVNAVCPGIIDTSRMDDLGREDTWKTVIKQMVPLNRPGTDEEIGKFIAYLCTPDASYITGQSINIDGGVVMW